MLKLMKYEFIHSMRTFMTALFAFMGACVALPFVIKMFSGNSLGELIVGFLGIIFIVLTVGIGIALFVSIFVNFHRSVFDKPGYLTLTLPKSNIEILLSKLIVSLLWMIIGSLVLFAGILLMITITNILTGDDRTVDFLLHMYSSFQEMIKLYGLSVVLGIINVIINLCFVISIIYFSICITHTKWIRKYRIILSVVIFFIIGSLIQGAVDIVTLEITGIMNASNVINICLCGGLSVVFILLTSYIMDHHIEVE